MSENQACYPVAVMCRVLGVSPSGFYAWTKRPLSARAGRDAALTERIRAAHAASKGTYGAPRLHIDLAEAGIHVGHKRGARLMRNAGLAGVTRRRHTVTTVRDGARQAPDLVDRDFTAERPNALWLADITYVPTWAGFLYLAVVLDALNMAIRQRRPSDVIHYSDQGSQYTAIEFGKRCREAPAILPPCSGPSRRGLGNSPKASSPEHRPALTACPHLRAPGASVRMVAPYAAINLIAAGTKGAVIFIPVTNAIERLHEEFKRRIKTQTVLSSAETAAMLFWALLVSGQISMRKIGPSPRNPSLSR